MTNQLNRKKQLVQLRQGEHRRTRARLAQAQSDLARLADLSSRLAKLRAGLAASRDLSSGQDLRMMGEMAARLDLARAALDGPMEAAAQREAQCSKDSARAAARRDTAARMLDEASIAHSRDLERRRDAALIRRFNAPRLKLVDGGLA